MAIAGWAERASPVPSDWRRAAEVSGRLHELLQRPTQLSCALLFGKNVRLEERLRLLVGPLHRLGVRLDQLFFPIVEHRERGSFMEHVLALLGEPPDRSPAARSRRRLDALAPQPIAQHAHAPVVAVADLTERRAGLPMLHASNGDLVRLD